MWLLYFLIIWLTPILLFFLLAYIDMKKGDSVKEYFKKYKNINIILFLVIPGVNIAFVLILMLFIIMDKIGDFRK